VCIWDVNNGERFETYALEGQPGSGVVCVNGAAAHKVNVGDLIIIAAFGWMPADEAVEWTPKVVFVDEMNRETDLGRKHEIGGQSLLRKVWG
jgi:aspartate 1-decarboxylase